MSICIAWSEICTQCSRGIFDLIRNFSIVSICFTFIYHTICIWNVCFHRIPNVEKKQKSTLQLAIWSGNKTKAHNFDGLPFYNHNNWTMSLQFSYWTDPIISVKKHIFFIVTLFYLILIFLKIHIFLSRCIYLFRILYGNRVFMINFSFSKYLLIKFFEKFTSVGIVRWIFFTEYYLQAWRFWHIDSIIRSFGAMKRRKIMTTLYGNKCAYYIILLCIHGRKKNARFIPNGWK